MGKSTLKVKLLQQFLAMREEVLHTIFLDLIKAYDALDSSRCLDILEGYGVCPMALRLFLSYWDLLQMVARAWGGLWRNPSRRKRRDAGGPTVSHHIRCGGGRSGPLLGIIGG